MTLQEQALERRGAKPAALDEIDEKIGRAQGKDPDRGKDRPRMQTEAKTI